MNWSFACVPTSNGSRPENIRVETTIATTLPLYVPPTNAPPELSQRWSKYFAALARHEAQHAAMATGAAADIQGRLSLAGERANCGVLRRDLNAMATAVVEARRREERQMDERTRHGAVDGARFP